MLSINSEIFNRVHTMLREFMNHAIQYTCSKLLETVLKFPKHLIQDYVPIQTFFDQGPILKAMPLKVSKEAFEIILEYPWIWRETLATLVPVIYGVGEDRESVDARVKSQRVLNDWWHLFNCKDVFGVPWGTSWLLLSLFSICMDMDFTLVINNVLRSHIIILLTGPMAYLIFGCLKMF